MRHETARWSHPPVLASGTEDGDDRVSDQRRRDMSGAAALVKQIPRGALGEKYLS